MKNLLIGVLIGALIASVGWAGYVWYIKAAHAAEICAFFADEAAFAEKLMVDARHPSDETRWKTQRAAASMTRSWILYVDETDQGYPFMRVKERLADQYARSVELLDKWNQTPNPTLGADGVK